ncbi:VENN motif pre-toxin domain-containing protein [Xenorhabdus sp. DI]|uniref:VENN motif pre-toxin domain-containing protein n=1 Tax=Xenorhabdus doucetiae TaxID=351671 RepID=UPI00199852B1|nr:MULTISPECIES: VENN motif pre-toxin domain-containing protein [unclassified Xenorhabdus]MBD2784148.1 VENN motif pre-toxin domain-containing protein [Xenorhabdus sp. 3]MBD2790211.1 VENN motif pre-toxin domain-containing protein [Xenorhabdus sp. DI]
MKDGSATARSVGAASGELAASAIAGVLYPDKNLGELSSDEKERVSNLSTIAGGLATDSTAGGVSGAQTAENAVDHNHLSTDSIHSRSEEMADCQGDSACRTAVRDKYRAEYDQVQDRIQNCSGAQQCVAVAKELRALQDDYSARMSEIQEKARTEGLSSLSEAEIREWTDLRSTLSTIDTSRNLVLHRAQITGCSEETTQEIVKIMGQTGIAAAAGVSSVGIKGKEHGASKGSNGTVEKSSPLPVPEPTKANNGLTYQSNQKHTPGQFGNRPNAGIEPRDSMRLFEQSIPSSKTYPNKEVRFSVDKDGNVHRFEGTNGVYHWNGSSGDIKNPLTSKQVPSDVQKKLGVRLK